MIFSGFKEVFPVRVLYSILIGIGGILFILASIWWHYKCKSTMRVFNLDTFPESMYKLGYTHALSAMGLFIMGVHCCPR